MQLTPDYICGFIDGEGCFTITISKHPQKKLGLDARLHFEVELRADDEPLLRAIQSHLKCGKIYRLNYERYGWHPHVELKVSSFKEIKNCIIPFFTKHPLKGKKAKSFQAFCEAAEIFERKEHLTLEGIEKLRQIRLRMNHMSKKSPIALES